MPLEFRPIGSQEPRYSVERDLALIFEQLAGLIPGVFASANMKTWIADHVAEHHLTEEQLQVATACFHQGLANFRDPRMSSVAQALQASGFWQLPEASRIVVFAAMGLIVTNAFYTSVRNQAVPEDTRHKLVLATPDTVEAIEAGNAVLNRDQRKLDAMAKARDLFRRFTGR